MAALRILTTDRLRRRLEERVPPRILDVRTSLEFQHWHLANAVNIPLAELAQRSAEIDPLVDVVVVSEHGIRSRKACEWLLERGYAKVLNLLGGLAELRFPFG